MVTWVYMFYFLFYSFEDRSSRCIWYWPSARGEGWSICVLQCYASRIKVTLASLLCTRLQDIKSHSSSQAHWKVGQREWLKLFLIFDRYPTPTTYANFHPYTYMLHITNKVPSESKRKHRLNALERNIHSPSLDLYIAHKQQITLCTVYPQTRGRKAKVPCIS